MSVSGWSLWVFTRDQAALIQSGHMTGVLLPAGTDVKLQTVRKLQRRVMRHDEDGRELGWRTETVMTGDGEDRQPAVITLLESCPVLIGEDTDGTVPTLTGQMARWCGHKNLLECRADWHGRYPGQHTALMVRFAFGDRRDRDRYLARGLGYTDVPGLSVSPDAPAVSDEVQRYQTRKARERDRARVADPDIKLRDQLVRALAEWENRSGGRASTLEAHKAIRGIRDQLRSLDRRLKAA